MSEVEIQTEHLTLILETTEQVLARIESMKPSDRAEISPEWLAQLQAATSIDPWTHGFSIINRSTGDAVGGCGYKGRPDQNGVVEIAYGINPDYRGRGFATQAASALVEYAFGTGHVRLVRAHTRPMESASTRVLQKCGFAWVGEVMDPEDGLVWRWEVQEPE